MHRSIQLRWIEQAEARAVLDHAKLQRAASEPNVPMAYLRVSRASFDWVRDLVWPSGRTAGTRRSTRAGATRRVKACSGTVLGISAHEAEDCDRVLVAVLITDIVESTKRVAEIGDHAWRVLLDRHDNATRYQIKRFGGTEVGTRGDGFVGIFDSPARAVRCAAAIADVIAPLGISLRSGIHVGEVQLSSGEISGIAVHTAARIAATACPGEAFVSKVVRDLVAGSGIIFEDRGTHQLRGLPEDIHLYAMRVIGAETGLS